MPNNLSYPSDIAVGVSTQVEGGVVHFHIGSKESPLHVYTGVEGKEVNAHALIGGSRIIAFTFAKSYRDTRHIGLVGITDLRIAAERKTGMNIRTLDDYTIRLTDNQIAQIWGLIGGFLQDRLRR